MKHLIAPFAGLAALAAVPAAAEPLAGVSPDETEIRSGGIAAVYVGNGDTIFARHVTNKWYRIALNDGCLDAVTANTPTFAFGSQPSSRVDRHTRVAVIDGSNIPFTCKIDSIRASSAPPQVDSNSIVTLD